jgi:hypothetical protein
MTMTLTTRLAVLLFLFLAGRAEAGSIFSFNGQGYPLRRLDPRAAGMGGAGRALVDGTNLSSFNPALFGAFQRPAMAGQYAIQRRNVEDLNSSQVIADGDLTSMKAIFPFKFRGAFSVGMEAVTDVDIAIVDTLGTAGDEHLLGLNGTGGVGAIVLGFGQKLGKRLFLGVQADLMVVGTLTETWSKDLLNESLSFFSLDKVTRSHRGVQFAIGGVYIPGKDLSLAVVAKPKATVTQRVLLENRLTTNAITSNAIESERKIQFPATLGFGLAYSRSGRWMAALDVEVAAWGDTGAGRHDTFEIAAGVQYQKGPSNITGIGRRYHLMGGAYRRSLYFATSSGKEIVERGATIGFGIPFKNRSGTFRWALDVGKRGDVQDHGASETFFKQTFSISGWIH